MENLQIQKREVIQRDDNEDEDDEDDDVERSFADRHLIRRMSPG